MKIIKSELIGSLDNDCLLEMKNERTTSALEGYRTEVDQDRILIYTEWRDFRLDQGR